MTLNYTIGKFGETEMSPLLLLDEDLQKVAAGMQLKIDFFQQQYDKGLLRGSEFFDMLVHIRKYYEPFLLELDKRIFVNNYWNAVREANGQQEREG